MDFILALGVLFMALTLCLYVYMQWIFSYWNKRGVPQLATKFPFGHFKDFLLMRQQIGFAYKHIYDSFKEERFVGTFMLMRAGILFRDLELINKCLVKDFKHFHHRGVYDPSQIEPLSANLFLLKGQKWKVIRSKLSPAFTSGKLKLAFSIISDAGAELGKCLEEAASNGKVVEVKEYIARYITDIIFTFAYGLDCNSLSNPDAEYSQLSKEIMRPRMLRSFALFLMTLFPFVMNFIPISSIDPKITKDFSKMFWKSVKYHESNNVKREDFMHFLIQLKNKNQGAEEETFKRQNGNINEVFSVNDLAAQAFFFFVAGFETSASTMSFCLYELALHLEVQRQLQREIDSVSAQYSGQFTYDVINGMAYLDKVVSETLRKYPPVPLILRQVTVPYLIPGTNVTLEKGTPVVIPVLAVHHDPRYYPDPGRFDPGRFSEEEKAKRPKYSYMPFGEGPRICIGMRYGLIQTKVGLVSILSHYNVGISEKTQIPPVIDPIPFVPSSVGGIWLKITKRECIYVD